MKPQILLLFSMAFLLPPGAWTGEIIGGHEAKPHSRPYMAYLEIRNGDNSSLCGGFLVSENFVLTAAHCDGDKITVILGAHNIEQWERSQQEIPVRRRIPHEEYNEMTLNNDIMLLQLEKRAKLNKWVGTIALSCTNEKVEAGTLCSVAGWGRMSTELELFPDTLREVDVMVKKDDACPRDPNGPYEDYNPSTMMCVGDPSQCKDSAPGDSGGPLVCGKTAQGIVSWGPCRAPGVYTRVSTFIPWIRETMGTLQP